MPPTVILIRHAEALHNVSSDWQIPDPGLTEKGFDQCQQLRDYLLQELPGTLDPEVIITSPMRRCCQTSMLSLDWLLDKGIPIHADANWQELTEHPCDTGSAIETIAAEFPRVGFSSVNPVYPSKAGQYAYNRRALLARAQACLEDLYARPEKVVVVCTHSGYLRHAVTGLWFANADYRIFDVERAPEAGDGSGGDGSRFVLRQWESTLDGGRGLSGTELSAIGDGLPEGDNKMPPSVL